MKETQTITIYPTKTLGGADHGWLKARHHFSFGDYRNPNRMQFGVLRVINDDRIAAGTGFDLHPHKDMEIITYVRKGAITHRDNMGNEGRTEAGDVQVMSAGKGVYHSEHNHEDEETVLYQIWIYPNATAVEPRWEAAKFPKKIVEDKLQLLVSGRKEDQAQGALFIHQDAALYGGRLKAGATISHDIKYQAYILVSEGEIRINGKVLMPGYGAEITGMDKVVFEAVTEAELLVIDVPKS